MQILPSMYRCQLTMLPEEQIDGETASSERCWNKIQYRVMGNVLAPEMQLQGIRVPYCAKAAASPTGQTAD